MEKLLLLGAFLLIRYLVTSSFKKKKNNPANAPKKSKPKKNLDDILGDFMKQLEQKAETKAQPVIINDDNHKAEADTHKKLDWQEVTTSRFSEKNQSTKHSDYKNISNSNSGPKSLETLEIEDEDTFELGDIDIRKAVLYKEILDRKYFTI